MAAIADTRVDALYYNLLLNTATKDTIGIPYSAGLKENAAIVNSSDPILYEPSEYYGLVNRLQFSGYSIPLVQFCVQTPVVDTTNPAGAPILGINNGIYSFTLGYNGFSSGQWYYVYEPQLHRGVPSPSPYTPPTGTLTQTFSDYYFIYDYDWIVQIMQGALTSAFNALRTAASPALNTCLPPIIRYDPVLGKLQFLLDPVFFAKGVATPVTIFFNSPSYCYMVGFAYLQITENDPQGLDNQLILPEYYPGVNSIVITGGPSAGTYQLVQQEYSSLEYMSPLRSVQVVTTMAVRPESFNVNDLGGSSSSIEYTRVVTDFLPDTAQPIPGISGYRFTYNAPALLRVFEILQKSPLRQISAQLQWTDFLGNTYPIRSPKGINAEVKYQFIRKDSALLGNLENQQLTINPHMQTFPGPDIAPQPPHAEWETVVRGPPSRGPSRYY